MNAQQPKKDAPNAPKELGKPFNPGVQVTRVRFSPDGKTLAAACFDGTVLRWDVTGKEPAELPPITGHNGWVTDIAFVRSPQKVGFLVADSWGRLTSWDVTANEPKKLWAIESAHDGWIRSVAVDDTASMISTCGKDGFVRQWAAGSGKPDVKWELGVDVLSIIYAAKGNLDLLAGDLFGNVHELKYAAGNRGRTFEAKELHKTDRVQDVGGVRCLLLSGDGKTLFAAGGEPKTGGFVQAIPLLIAFDRAAGKRIGQYKGATDNEGYVTDLAWHPDGYVIATTSGQPGQGTFFFWKPGEEKPFFVSKPVPNCHSVALHPAGDRLAVSATNANSSGNGRVKGKGGEYPGNSSPDHTGSVTCRLTPRT